MAHGFYHLVRLFDETLFERVRLPEHKCFIKGFEEWQKKNDFPKGKQFYHYPEEMDEANLILQKPIPVIHRCKSYGRWMVDVENLLMICQIFSPIMPKGAFIQPTEKGYVWYKSS